MLRRTSFFSMLVGLSLSIAGCGGPPDRPWIPTMGQVTMPFGMTDVNPQSRGYRGGYLQNFHYFFAQGDHVPPQVLPKHVTGYLVEFGDVEVELTSANVDGCVTSGVVPLYDVRVQTTDGLMNPCAQQLYSSGPDNVCLKEPITLLQERAIAVPGAWSEEDGHYYETKDDKPVFTLACMTGVAAKCVNWGYPPWGNHDGAPADYFTACVQAARAEYKRATAYTCTGTLIDVYDRLNIQTPSTSSETPLLFEAAWSKDGPICINQPRFPACEEQVQQIGLPACNEEEFSGKNSEKWPGGALLVTRSTGDNTTGTEGKECPNKPELCNSAR
jgi:hypothetical protein